VGDRAHERDREDDESGRDAGDRDLHRRRQQTGAFGQGHAHDDDHDRDERWEGLVGVERGVHGHGDALAAEEVVHRGPVPGAGILDSRAGEGEDEAEYGEDRREDPEQPEGVRQLVADDFDDVEGADDQRQLLLLVGLHGIGGLGRFHCELLRVQAGFSGRVHQGTVITALESGVLWWGAGRAAGQ
jgi:hypothetical protein